MAAIEMFHPATGNTIEVYDEAVADVHAESGWLRVGADGTPIPGPARVVEVERPPAPPQRPADDAPPRKWLAYAEALGLDIDPDTIESAEQLRELIGAHLAAHETPAEADKTEDTTPDEKPKGRNRGAKNADDPGTTTDVQED